MERPRPVAMARDSAHLRDTRTRSAAHREGGLCPDSAPGRQAGSHEV